MRVLFYVREDLQSHPGGDTVQILCTAAALRQRGVEVTITSDPSADASSYDCIHLWHLERVQDTYIYLQAALRSGRPIALSPIYWPETGQPRPRERLYSSRWRWWKEDAKNLVRWALARSPIERKAIAATFKKGWARCRQEILESADVILPNSRAEAELIAEECGIDEGQGDKETRRQGENAGAPLSLSPCPLVSVSSFLVVPNVIDLSACDAILSESPQPPRTDILCAGHFDRRKNQLFLIDAVKGLDVSITFLGGPRRLHRRYYDQCQAASQGKHRFPGPQSHTDVLRRMRCAKVHICPSRYETPGLVNLEAAVMGCAIVVPDCPPVREYFQEDAIYFDVDSPNSLRQAVERAIAEGPSPHLAERVRSRFNFPVLAEKTLEAYSAIKR
jgi:glycosyltransferase involved in cell wall biosynthesis